MAVFEPLKTCFSSLPPDLTKIVNDTATKAAMRGIAGVFSDSRGLIALHPLWVPMFMEMSRAVNNPMTEEEADALFRELYDQFYALDPNYDRRVARINSMSHNPLASLAIKCSGHALTTLFWGRCVAHAFLKYRGGLTAAEMARVIVGLAVTN